MVVDDEGQEVGERLRKRWISITENERLIPEFLP